MSTMADERSLSIEEEVSTELIPPTSSAAPFAPVGPKSELKTEPIPRPSTPTSAPLSLSDSHPIRTSSIPIQSSSPSSSLQAPSVPQTPLSPARRRPKPPTKGILKPPPPPPKPTLGNRLRDLAANVVGGPSSGTGSRGFFDSDDAGPSSAGPSGMGGPGAVSPGSVSAAVGGTLNALGGRIGMGLSRFVNGGITSPVHTPNGSPMSRVVGLPDVSTSPSGLPYPQAPGSEKVIPRKQRGPLRRATFVLPSLSITYPISSQGEPWSVKVIEDRKRIESSHRTLMSATTGAEYWTAARLVKLYETACKGREEKPRVAIVRALETLPPHPRPRNIHLQLRPDTPPSNPNPVSQDTLDSPLNRHAAEALADVLSSEWGLSDVKLEGGVLEDDLGLKPILHALLVSGTLPSLSLAGNRKLRERAWRLLAIFLKKARSLKYVDLSDTTWDRRSIDYLVQALTATAVRSPTIEQSASLVQNDNLGLSTSEDGEDDDRLQDCYGSFVPHAPLLKDAEEMRAAGLQTLRMDGCQLRASLLEPLASGIRTSDIRNLSLRRNKIGPTGAVALALMIRDYPDISSSAMTAFAPSSDHASLTTGNPPYTPRSRRTNDSSSPSLASMLNDNLPALPPSATSSPSRPPAVPPKTPNGLSTLGITHPDTPLGTTLASVEGRISGPDTGGASVALQRQVRSLDGVERIGRLLTLDLKSNEIRNGVTYIAQVLKRNRTLKVLNLSDNRIEPSGLLALAEALKYNSTLETLDLSSNPCCGPSLEGITALRTAFTVNTSLKRLFLSDTNLHPEGAIALAEFLPESHSLLHLDLTSNPLDIAGILALSSGLKSNTMIRCLDLSIPPNNPDLADLSQGILQTCIRNTELAAESTGRGADAVWGPIKKSVLVRQVKEAENFRAEQERLDVMSSPEGLAREYVYKLTPGRLVGVCENTGRDMEKWLAAGLIAKSGHFTAWEPGQLPREEWRVLLERAKALRERLADEIQRTADDAALARMLELNDSLGSVIDTARDRRFVPPPRLLLPSQMVTLPPPPQPQPVLSTPTHGKSSHGLGMGIGVGNPSPMSARHRRHMRGTSLEISSPNFSIGDSDNDSDAEELDVGRLPNTPQPPRVGELRRGDLRLEAEDEAAEALREAGDFDVEEGVAASPVERVGKAWMEEEGEIFRKGTKLGVGLGVDEAGEEVDEGLSGEVLRQEILETEVARSPARRVVDDDSNVDESQKDEGDDAEERKIEA